MGKLNPNRPVDPNTGLKVLHEGQEKFMAWLLDPNRNPKSMAEYSRQNGMSTETLSQWKKDKSFRVAWEKKAAELNIDIGRIQEVVNAIWNKASSGDINAAKLYLEYVNKFTPTQRVVTQDKSVEGLSDAELAEQLEEGVRHLRSVAE